MFIKGKTLIVYQWDSPEGFRTSKNLVPEIKSGKYTDVIFAAHQEYEISWNDITGFDPRYIEKLLVTYNVQLTIIYGSLGPCMDARRDPILNTTVIYLPLFFLYDVALTAPEGKFLITDEIPTYPKDKFAISFNNKPHRHRCQTMDVLAEYEMLDDVYFSWNELSNEASGYEFEYWQEKITSLDDNYKSTLDSDITPPAEQWKAAFDIVTESQDFGFFLTEKTWNAILRGRPFIIIGKPGTNNILEEFGFKTYLADFRLTHIEFDWAERAKWERSIPYRQYLRDIIGRIREVIDSTTPEELHSRFDEKIKYNRKRLKDIADNWKYIPPSLFRLVERTGVTFKELKLFPLDQLD